MNAYLLETFKRASAVLASMLILLQITMPLTAFADGLGSSDACRDTTTNVIGSVGDDEDEVTYDAGAGFVVEGVCIKSGNFMFGGNQHSGVLGNGTFESCYAITGVGTQVVNVSRLGRTPDCQGISHIDVVVKPIATVEVIKKLNPTDDPGKFNLKVEGVVRAENVGHNGATGKVNVNPDENITVSETQGSGTSINNYNSSIVCKNNNGAGEMLISANSTSATMDKADVDAGDKIVCTITNTRKDTPPPLGSVKVHKEYDAEGDNSYVYDDTAANTLGFRWGLDGAAPDRVMGIGGWLQNVSFGEHTVNENSLPDWEFTGWFYTGEQGYSCTHPRPGSLPITINVATVDITHVTLCNQKEAVQEVPKGSITINKYVMGGNKKCEDFHFTVNGGTPIQFEADCTNVIANLPTNTTYSIVEVEANTDGYVTTYSWPGNMAAGNCSNISLANPMLAMCTITNTYPIPNKLGGVKFNDLNGNGARDQNEPGLAGWTIELFTCNKDEDDCDYLTSTSTTADGSYLFEGLDSGNYKVCEVQQPGWTQTYPFLPENYEFVPDINPTADKCWFVNLLGFDLKIQTADFGNKITKPKGSITVIKELEDEEDALEAPVFNFTTQGSGLTDFSLDVNGVDSKTFTDLVPGEYSITEILPDEWDLDNVECTLQHDEDWDDWEDEDETVTVDLDSGEHITCVFTNEKDNGGQPPSKTVFGHKFNDLNNNGLWDSGEPAIKDWKINLYKEVCVPIVANTSNLPEMFVNNAQTQAAEPNCSYLQVGEAATTDVNGEYAFTVTFPGGKYKICEEQIDGWTQTLPKVNDGCYFVSVPGDNPYGPYDFGNRQPPAAQISYTASVICIDSFPYLSWSATPVNFVPTKFTLDWRTVAGNDAGDPAGLLVHTQTYTPAEVNYDLLTNTYSANTLWPGASTSAPEDWPGWDLVNGLWVENPNDFGGNLRPAADITLTVNPTVQAPAGYPPEAENCGPTNGEVLGASTLANTGTPWIQGLFVGSIIIGAAGGVTYLNRRKSHIL